MARKKTEEVKETKMMTEKDKSLDLAMKQIQKEYGEGSIMKLGDSHLDWIDSNSYKNA
jgi:recombination protein RecA